MKFSPALSRNLLAAAAVLAAAPSALAHPGHSMHDANLMHLATSPNHLLWLAVTGLAMFGGAFLIHQRTPRRAVQCAGILSLVAAFVLW